MSQQSSILKDFLIAGVSSSISRSIIAPFDSLSISTASTNGILSLWRGNLNRVCGFSHIGLVSNFPLNEMYKKLIIKNDQETVKSNPFKFCIGSILSGGFAGITSMLLFYPIELSRIKLEFDKYPVNNTRLIKYIKHIYSKNGFIGLYKGIGLNNFTNSYIYYSFYFGGFNIIKSILLSNGYTFNIYESFIVSQLVTSATTLITLPLKVGLIKNIDGERRIGYMSTINRIKEITSKQGRFKYCFSISYRSFSNGLTLMLFDQIQRLLNSIEQ